MAQLYIAIFLTFLFGTTSPAFAASCSLEDAVFKSGEYTLRFSPIPDYPLYQYNLSIKGLGLDVAGDTTVPNGFARAFYSIERQDKSERIGAIYFVWEKTRGNLTEEYALIGEPAPLAVVLAEFSRTMYYTQRDQGEEINVPPTDLFSFTECEN